MDYLEKSKHLQNQLRELRCEIEVLKVGEKQSQMDALHQEQLRLGENKYSTLRKVSINTSEILNSPSFVSYHATEIKLDLF